MPSLHEVYFSRGDLSVQESAQDGRETAVSKGTRYFCGVICEVSSPLITVGASSDMDTYFDHQRSIYGADTWLMRSDRDGVCLPF